MPNASLRALTCALALIAATGIARAQSPAADTAIRDAIEAAERGQPVDAARFSRDPLYGWLEYAALRRNIDTLPDAGAQSFLSRYRGQAVAEAFRSIWLASTSRRQDWPAFRAAWSPAVKDVGLRCAELDARQATGAVDAQWTRDAQEIWRSSGKSLPDSCDAPFAVLAAKGGLPPEVRWERIDKAAAQWQPAVMRSAARGLPADQFALSNDYAAFFEAVNDRALGWPKTPRSRLMASQGLARLAKSTPVAAENAMPRFASALDFTEADRARVLYQVALWTVASYDPDSARRLNAVPESAYDERLHEWRVREAMARGDWPAAFAVASAPAVHGHSVYGWSRRSAARKPWKSDSRAAVRYSACAPALSPVSSDRRAAK